MNFFRTSLLQAGPTSRRNTVTYDLSASQKSSNILLTGLKTSPLFVKSSKKLGCFSTKGHMFLFIKMSSFFLQKSEYWSDWYCYLQILSNNWFQILPNSNLTSCNNNNINNNNENNDTFCAIVNNVITKDQIAVVLLPSFRGKKLDCFTSLKNNFRKRFIFFSHRLHMNYC